jgi:hypothetical protein
MSYEQFWPTPENGSECLATEAEAIGDAVFLAVHQPMRLYRSSLPNTSEPELLKETDLLRSLLEKNPANGTLLIPIVGDSGVGKSHMIHWLDAQLRHRPDGILRKITRIPKSASLRSVLQLILDGLNGKEYDEIREEIITAQLALTPDEATIGLREKLLLELDRKNKDAQVQLQRANHPSFQEIVAFTNPQCIPALLEDPQLRDHFRRTEGNSKGVLCRIAERAIQGARTNEGPENQFTEEDLTFPDVEIHSLSAHTKRAVQILSRNDGEGRKVAVRILNQVIDPAIASLLKFDGNSLSDLFVRLRKQLLKDKTELVLLVEDFAALAGIQGSLLDATIRQGIESGKQTLCVMRTALAVTEGYLANRETVLTRARYEWQIEDQPFQTEEDAVETYANFIGGYLNAARLGAERLENKFEDRSPDDDTLQEWLPSFYQEKEGDLDEKDKCIINSFGFSKNRNHPLFPFNKESIRQVLRQKFYKPGKGNYEFNPRRLIGIVLRETLIDCYPLFQNREFPPAGWLQFQQTSLEVPVVQEIRKRQPSDEGRLSCLVYYWGNCPATPGQAAAIPQEIFKAFGAPLIAWSEEPLRRTDITAPPPPPVEENPLVSRINRWRRTGVLTQHDANKIRELLRDEIKSWIDWDAMLLEPVKLNHQWIHLPRVQQGNPLIGKVMARAAEDDAIQNGQKELLFFAGLLAVVRYRENDCSWNYDGAEQDVADYRALIEPMVAQTVEWLHRRSHGLTQTDIKTLAQASLLGSRLLRIDGAATNSDTENLKAAFAEVPEQEGVTEGNDRWSIIQGQARKQRPAILAKLKPLLGARQGGAEKIHAVDASVLLPAISELRRTMAIPNGTELEAFEAPLREHLRQLGDPLRIATESRAEAIGVWHSKITGFLGESFEIAVVVEQLRNAITEATRAGVYASREIEADTLKSKLSELQNLKIKENLTLARIAADATDLSVSINNIAQFDRKVESTLLGTLEQYDEFLRRTSTMIATRLSSMPPSPVDQGNRLAGKVCEIEEAWNSLGAII